MVSSSRLTHAPVPTTWLPYAPTDMPAVQFEGNRPSNGLMRFLVKWTTVLGMNVAAIGGTVWSHGHWKAADKQILAEQKKHEDAGNAVEGFSSILAKKKSSEGVMGWLKNKAAELVISKDEQALRKDLFKLLPKEQYAAAQTILDTLDQKKNPTDEDYRQALVDFIRLATENNLQPGAQQQVKQEIEVLAAFEDGLKDFQFPKFAPPEEMESQRSTYFIAFLVSLLGTGVVGLMDLGLLMSSSRTARRTAGQASGMMLDGLSIAAHTLPTPPAPSVGGEILGALGDAAGGIGEAVSGMGDAAGAIGDVAGGIGDALGNIDFPG